MKQETIDKINHYGYEVKIKKEGHCTDFVLKKQKEEYEVSIVEDDLTYYLYADDLEDVDEKVIVLIVEEKEKEANEKKKWLVLDGTYGVGDLLKEKEYVWLDGQDEIEMDELEVLTNECITDQEVMVSRFTAQKIKEYIKTYQKTTSILYEYNEKEDLYQYEEGYDEHCLHIDGKNFDLAFEMDYEGINMVIKDAKTEEEKQSFTTIEQNKFKENFESWLLKIKKQQKIKKVFEPSSFFFEKLLDELYLDRFSPTTQGKLKELLLNTFSPNEIEETSASYLKKGLPKIHQLTHSAQFFYFNEIGLLLNSASDDIQIIQKTENTRKEIYEILRENWEKEVRNALKEI